MALRTILIGITLLAPIAAVPSAAPGASQDSQNQASQNQTSQSQISQSQGSPSEASHDRFLPAPDAGPEKARPPGKSVFYFLTPRSVLDREVHTIPADDASRLTHLRADFAKAGCVGKSMTLQAIWKRHAPAGSNLICRWQGTTGYTVVVAAHYGYDGRGQGAVDDWSGAVLLPYLYLAVQAQPRENTWVFIETWGKHGAADYLKSLPRDQRNKVRAMIALDGLGLHPVARYFSPQNDTISLAPGTTHLELELLSASRFDGRVPTPQATDPQFWLRVDDTQDFRGHRIPAIIIHSVADSDAGIPGSPRDTSLAVDANAYYQNYRLLCAYFVSLDGVAAKLAVNDRFWGPFGGVDPQNLRELPPDQR